MIGFKKGIAVVVLLGTLGFISLMSWNRCYVSPEVQPLTDFELVTTRGTNPDNGFIRSKDCADVNLGTGEVTVYTCINSAGPATCVQCEGEQPESAYTSILSGSTRMTSVGMATCYAKKQTGPCSQAPRGYWYCIIDTEAGNCTGEINNVFQEQEG